MFPTMSLTKKRKQLIAASLAAMTAFGATVPAIVASAPAAFAVESDATAATAATQNGNSETTSTVTLTPGEQKTGASSTVINVYTMTNSGASDIKAPQSDFKNGAVDPAAEGFAEVTVNLAKAGTTEIVDSNYYVVKQTNPAITAWYGDNWTGSFGSDGVTEGEVHDANGVKLKRVQGSDLKTMNFLTQEGNTVTFEIYESTSSEDLSDKTPDGTLLGGFEFVDNMTYTDVVEPVSADITVDAATGSYALTGERVPAGADFTDSKQQAEGFTDDSFTQGTIAFNVADAINDGDNYVLVQKNPAIWNWYTTNWTGAWGVGGVDSVSGEVHEGTSAETAVKYKKYTGAQLKKATTFLMQKGGTATFEIYKYVSGNAI